METIVSPGDYHWGVVVLGVIVRSTMVLAVAWAVSVVSRRSSAAFRHATWTLALAASLLVPCLYLALPVLSWPVLPAAGQAGTQTRQLIQDAPALVTMPLPSTPPSFPVARFEQEAAPASVASSPAQIVPWSPRSLKPWIIGLWSVGAILVLTGPLTGRMLLQIAIRRTRLIDRGGAWSLMEALADRLGIRRSIRLHQGGLNQMPMTWGSITPVILLPLEFDEWPHEQQRDVLLHELAHVRRFDCLTQIVAQIACAAQWFNPLVWLASAQMHSERELACDDLVLRLGGTPSDYAGSLLAMARKLRSGRAAALAAVAMARPSQLEGRLLAILDPTRERGGLSRRATLLAFIGLAVLLLPISAVQLTAREVNPRAEESVAVKPNAVEAKALRPITGQVLDPDGKPVADAVVDVVGMPKYEWVPAALEPQRSVLLGQAKTDRDGRFRMDSPNESASRFYGVRAVAFGTGLGIGWGELNLDSDQPTVQIKLHPEQPMRAKFVDIMGTPAANVEVRLTSVMRQSGPMDYDGFGVGDNAPEQIRAWPASLKTDERGIVTFRGIPRGFTADLAVRDMRFARQELFLKADGDGRIKDAVLALKPARIIEGRVLAADTGRPLPNSVVTVQAPIDSERGRGWHTTNFPTDDQGRFRVNPPSGDEYTLWAFAPAGEPYLIQTDKLQWKKGAVLMKHDLKLPRGVVIQGKISEQGSGRPVGKANIQFNPSKDNDKLLTGWQALQASKPDGSFQLVVPVGSGRIMIHASDSNYVLESGGRPGSRRVYAHKILSYEAKDGEPPRELNADLKSGRTVRGRVVGPDGQAVPKATIISAMFIGATNPWWRGDNQLAVRDGKFEIRGVSPDSATRFSFLDEEHDWGATVELAGKKGDEEITVKLEPCGRAKARFVGPDGKPLAKLTPHFEFVATPGPAPYSRNESDLKKSVADADYVANVQRKHYWPFPKADSEGRIVLPALIPGALYYLSDFSTVNDPKKGAQVRKEITVKPGETVDVGDVLIEKPGQP